MAIESVVVAQRLRRETRLNLVGANSRGDPEPSTGGGTERQSYWSHVLSLWRRLASFFKIGCGYDWEEQYREYSEYWENRFQASQPG
jgi:hypothetical protein